MRNAMIPGFGGPMGQHARPRGMWFRPESWAILAAVVVYLLTMMRQLPCIQTDVMNQPDPVIRLCYSDISVSWFTMEFNVGNTPFNKDVMDLPPVLGVLVLLTIQLTRTFGGKIGREFSGQEQLDAQTIYLGITSVWLLFCFVVWVIAMGRIGRRGHERASSWDGLIVALSPIVLATGFIDWSLLPIAICAIALWQFSEGHWLGAAICFGIASAAGWQAILVTVAVALCILLRAKASRAGLFLLAATATFLVLHLPIWLQKPDLVWTYYAGRISQNAGYGSLWLMLTDAFNLPVREVGALGFLLMLITLGAISAWLYLTGKKPRVGTVIAIFLLVAFLVGPTFPPQFAMWVLFAVMLARPYRWELIAVTVVQVVYWAAVWGWIAQHLQSTRNGPANLYWLAILLRMAVDVVIIIRCIKDIRQPERDRMRTPNLVDPVGGMLNHGENIEPVRLTRRERSLARTT